MIDDDIGLALPHPRTRGWRCSLGTTLLINPLDSFREAPSVYQTGEKKGDKVH